MKKKNILIFVLTLFFIINNLMTVLAEPDTDSDDNNQTQTDVASPAPHAQAALLADCDSGKILYQKNADQKMYPASTTKILTGILALENCTMTDVVTATVEAINPITLKHSHMGILIGEELTVEQLMYGLLVYSANDAANVLAVHIAGSLDGFVAMMNQKAAELGMTGSHFANPHGFHDDNHYTTCTDLFKVTRYAMQNEKFREIVATDMYTMPPTNKYDETRYLSSTNHLISRRRYANYFYNKAIGVKTGFTDEAGSCLVSCAVDEETELISIIMGCQNTTMVENGAYSFTDSKDLLEYGFENFNTVVVAAVGDIVSDSNVYEARDNIRVALTVENDISNILPYDYDKNQITSSIDFGEEKVSAPIKKGDIIGTISYSYKGEEIGTSKLVATNDVKKDYIIATIHLFIKIITNPIFLILLALIIFLRIRAVKIQYERRRRRRNRLQHIDQSQTYQRRRK